MRKIIVYGLGRNYEKYKSIIFSRYSVVALMDGSLALQGKTVDGYEVLSPDILEVPEFDYILITPFETVASEIADTLINMGYNPDSFIFFHYPSTYMYKSDSALINKYICKNRSAEKGFVTDLFGVKHCVNDIPHLSHYDNCIIDTMVCQEDMELVGLLYAVESRKRNEEFVMFEIGAGWGPWMSAAAFAVNADKRENENKSSISIIGIEAEPGKILLAKRHLGINGLLPASHKTDKEVFSDEETLKQLIKVRYIVIGTHSREIETKIFRTLYKYGFALIREKPCTINPSMPMALGEIPRFLTDMTTVDGVQVWKNLRFEETQVLER